MIQVLAAISVPGLSFSPRNCTQLLKKKMHKILKENFDPEWGFEEMAIKYEYPHKVGIKNNYFKLFL